MKNPFLFLFSFLLLSVSGSTAQPLTSRSNDEGLTKDPDLKSHVFYIGTALYEYSSIKMQGVPVYAEYLYNLSNVWSVGVDFAYVNFNKRRSSYLSNENKSTAPTAKYRKYDTYQIAVKSAWDLPVAKDRLFLRVGFGFGLMSNNLRLYQHTGELDKTSKENAMLFSAEINWIVKVWGDRMDIKLSPLIWGPSRFRVGGLSSGNTEKDDIFNNDMASIAVGIRW